MPSLFYKLPIILLFLLSACENKQDHTAQDPMDMTWSEITEQANGTTVHMLTWMGDTGVNSYMLDYVVPSLKTKYNIDLQMASVAGPRIVSFLMAEREANKSVSEADMVWMAGRTSYQLRQLGELYGPFTDHLPSSAYIDYNNPYIGWDYEIPLNGFEAPWGMGQFLLISDKARVLNPPQNMAQLKAWVMEHPGRFTLEAGFTTLAYLKALLVETAGSRDVFTGEFREELYLEHSQKLWQYLEEIRPYMWREGTAFPRSLAQMHQMFANGEIDFTMSYNDGEADSKIASGLYPDTVYGFTWDSGTPKNSHYLAIVKNAPNKVGAMVVINFLLSAEAQYEKLNGTWGDGTIIDTNRLDVQRKAAFLEAGQHQHAPQIKDIEQYAFLELRPEYIGRLYEDYLKYFIRKGEN